MAYLGNAPARSFISFERQVFTIVNSQTAYTLDHSVNNENDIRLVINNIVQEPGSGKAYTASGTTLTLSAALVNGTDEMYCVFLGRAVATNAPGAGSVNTAAIADLNVTTAKIAADAITEAKIADDAVESEHLNDNVISGQTELAVAPDSTDELLISDGGTLKRIDVSLIGGVNSPRFRATMGSNQSMSDNVAAKIQFNTEDYDIGSCFDTSNYRFTVPSGEGGLYLINAQIQLKSYDDTYHIESFIKLYKNGSATYYSYDNFSGNYINGNMLYNTQVINLSAADYIEVYGQCNVTTNSPECKAGYSYFQGFKLIT